ncbi:unnamed protein product [Urochloa humidicola]
MGNTCGVTLRSMYLASFRGGASSQRHDSCATVVTSAAADDHPAPPPPPHGNGKRAARPAAPPPAASMRRGGTPAPAELRANVLGHPTPSLRDHYATVVTSAAADDHPAPPPPPPHGNGKRAARPAAPPPAASMRRGGTPAPAELRANVLGHPTPSLRDHYATVVTSAAADDHPAPPPNGNGKRAAPPAAPPPAAGTRRGGAPAPAELRANVLGHPTPSLRDHYALGRKLGQGQFGTTYLCTDLSTGVDYACKSIAKSKIITKEDVYDVHREIQIMHHLAGQRNVVAIKGAYEDHQHVHIVMDLCAGGELFDRIKQRGRYSEREAAELTRIIVGVVEACHSLGVMHRDLKPENFLLANKDNDMSLKAIDFGLSVFFKPGQIFTDCVGTPYYVAPEVLRKRYGPEAEMWTAGVILYILLSGGEPPFWAETREGIFDAVLKGVIDFCSDPWPGISECAKDLIRRMLNPCPAERLTAHQVLCHPWICDQGVAPDRLLDPAVLSRIKQFSAMNKMKKMSLQVIAKSLSEEEIAGLKEVFMAMDTDCSGAITYDELKEGLRKYGSTPKDSEIHDLMDAVDIDNNGTIDYIEFIAATLHPNKLEHEEHLQLAFSYFDKDGNGYITVDELQQACKEHNMPAAFLDDVIKEADHDNDGRIDYGEFVAMMS